MASTKLKKKYLYICLSLPNVFVPSLRILDMPHKYSHDGDINY